MSRRCCEKVPQNGPEYSHRNLAIARFLVVAGTINIGGLRFGWSHWANSPWGGRGPSYQSPGGGCCQSAVLSVTLSLGESVHS